MWDSITMETITFRPKLLREETDLQDPPRRGLEQQEIKLKLYLRECEKLRVIPVSAYLRQANNKALHIKHYNIGPNGAKALAAAILLDNTLSHLDIEGNSITPEGLCSIKEALVGNIFVTFLNVSDNKLGSQGAKLLGVLMKENTHIDTLIASRNGFKDADAGIFATVIKENRTLKELNLSGNEFEEMAGVALGHALSANESLERLDLSWNNIRKRGAAELAHGVKENVGLKKLNVSFNGLGTEGAACMGQALGANRTLLELDLSKNRITNIDMCLLAKQMKANDTLQVLKIGENLFNGQGAIEILKAVMTLDTSSVKLIDFGTTSVDLGFMQVYEELKTSRPHLVVKYGRVQNIYLDEDMKPPPIITDQADDTESLDQTTDLGQEEKGKTYVISTAEYNTSKPDSDNQTMKQTADDTGYAADDNERDNKDQNTEADDSEIAPGFDENKLDEEVSAVTGKAEKSQKPLVEDRASVGTYTPDI